MYANFRKVLVAAAMIGTAPSAFADVITDWNEKAVAFVTPQDGAGRGPDGSSRSCRSRCSTRSTRSNAAIGPIWFSFRPLRRRRRRPPPPLLPAPSWRASHPQEARQLKAAMAAYLATIPDGDAKSEGIKLGEAVAAKILEARAKDGADAPDAYRYKTKPGVYVPTPITVSSTWPKLKPFALDERVAIPAGSRRSRSRASSGPPTTTRSRILAARPAPSVRLGRPRTPASG